MGNRNICWKICCGVMLLTLTCFPERALSVESTIAPAPSYGLGRTPTTVEIQSQNIDVSPTGAGLPPGSGSVQQGRQVYLKKCAMCHGLTGKEGPQPKLVGGHQSLSTPTPLKTIGSYWPFATTLYDYIYRAMPFIQPQSLTPDEVYSLVAWLLYQNEILPADGLVDQKSLPEIRMPNREGFKGDPRPDTR